MEKFPTIFHFPSFDRFVIFDLETTGLEKSARPFQLSAIKVENMQITEFIDLYANLPPDELGKIPYTLRLKLRLNQPSMRERIEKAPPLEEVLKQFTSFLSDYPLIAHNIWFDLSVLNAWNIELKNHFLDSIELFSLAFPLANSYSLEELVEEIGVGEEIQHIQKELSFEESFPHNALYDCLAVYCLIKKALEKLKESRFLSLLHLVSPHFAQFLSLPPPPNDFTILFPQMEEDEEELTNIMREPNEYRFDTGEVMDFYEQIVKKGIWEKRDSQRKMIGKVAELFYKGKIGMIEAPTGTGKTLAYLLPASFLVNKGGGKVIIATYTKHLQNQAVSDLEKKLLPYLPHNFRYVVFKGRGNYICLRRFLLKLEDAFQRFFEETEEEERFLLLYIGRFIEEVGDRIEDLDAFPYWLSRNFPFLASLKENIKSDRDICLNYRCPFHSKCFFKRAERKAREADLIITNHWLLLMKRWDDPQDCSIVIDEAHNLEDAASDAFGSEVSKESFSTLLSLFLNKEGKRGILLRLRKSLGNVEELRTSFAIMRDFWQMLDEIGSALYSFFLSQKIIPHRVYGASLWMKRLDKRGEDEWAKVREILKKIQEAMERLEFSLDRLILMLSSKLPDLADEMKNLRDKLVEMVEQLISLTSWDYEKNKVVRWIELELTEDASEDIDMISPPPQYINWAIREAPIRVNEYLRERIYERFRSVVLTSATLTVAGKGFSFFLDRLGLEDLVSDDDLLSLPPVYNYKENVLLLLPDYLSSDASHNNLEKFKEDVLEELRHFLSYVEGRSLVLFAARDRLEYVGERLESVLGERMLPVYWQRRGVSKRHLLREFRDIEEATLLGLRSFWEGIDVPGPSLSYLILEKLPFPSLSEPLFQARREEVRRRGKDEYMDYLLPMTIIPFKQGFGRLIRQHEDRGVVIFLDKRLRSDTQSREIALGSLPGFKRSKEWEKSRKALYRAVSEHMKPLFPNFPWAEKLEKIEELTIKEIPQEKEEILWQEDILNNLKKGDFLLQTLNIAHLLSLLLKKGMRTIILSPSDPSYLLQSFNQPIPYIPAQPVLNISQFMRSWEEETSILALHPHWLADEEIRKLVRKADVLIITNPLQLHYSSTFFDPILEENLPQETRKIFLLPSLMEDALNLPPPFRDMPIIKSEEEAPPIVFGRIEEIYPLLTKARENDKDVLIYSPDGEELEKRLNKMGFFASWGEDKLSLFQKDLLNILILPPGKRADKMGTSLIVHYPPTGDKLSYLLEASQAQLGGEVGYALSCFENEPSLKMLMESLFPDEEKDFQEFEALIKERKRVLLSLKTISAKFHRLIYLYSQSGKVEWQLVETMVDVILNKDVEDKRLKEILAKSKISPNKVKSLNLLEASRANGVSLEELSSALRRSLLRGELFYEIKAKAILVKAKDLNRKTIQPPVSRKEILEEWLELREWLYNKPPLELE